MPGFIARKLCPELVIVPLTSSKYEAVSGEVRAVLRGYDPTCCPVGLDEAYLDITEGAERRLLEEQDGGEASNEDEGVASNEDGGVALNEDGIHSHSSG